MKTMTELLDFCNVFTFYDHSKNERVIKLKHVRACVMSVLSKSDFISEDEVIRMLGVTDEKSLMIIDENVEDISVELNDLRVGLLQLLCLEKSNMQEAKFWDMKYDWIDGKNSRILFGWKLFRIWFGSIKWKITIFSNQKLVNTSI